MSSKLDKFRGELDTANYKMSGIRNSNKKQEMEDLH